ncbi:hypothetical protein D0463_16255 [Bacillus sp. V59.32b]|nr:hypothetical protein D0463_16255 [Bacillus sp. V59.32b]
MTVNSELPDKDKGASVLSRPGIVMAWAQVIIGTEDFLLKAGFVIQTQGFIIQTPNLLSKLKVYYPN